MNEVSRKILEQVNSVIIGKEAVTEKVLMAVLAQGHVLLEDVPGVGKTTLALAFVMAMNYLAVLLCPFIVDFFQSLFHVRSQEFPFIFNLCITILALIWAYRRKTDFLFRDKL